MEAAIEKSTNDELKTLQIKLSILEDELRKALARADAAETELEQLKGLKHKPEQPMLPPPPPPPMPAALLYKASPLKPSVAGSDASFSGIIAMKHDLHTTNVSGGEGVATKLIETVKQQVQPEAATGRFVLNSTPKG